MTAVSFISASAFLVGLQVPHSIGAQIAAISTHKTSIRAVAAAPASLRLKAAASPGWRRMRRRLPVGVASETSSSEAELDDAGKKTDSGGQGPPFLTILAGLVVFLFILWMVGSILMWLIGLIINVPRQS